MSRIWFRLQRCNNQPHHRAIQLASTEDLPKAGPVTGLINANSNIADLEEKSTEEPEGGSEISLEDKIRDYQEERQDLLQALRDKDATIEELSRGHIHPVLTVDAEVKSIEPNGGAGDNHGYTVRVEPIGGDNLPFGFSLGQIKSAAAKKLAIGKKYRITVTEA